MNQRRVSKRLSVRISTFGLIAILAVLPSVSKADDAVPPAATVSPAPAVSPTTSPSVSSEPTESREAADPATPSLADRTAAAEETHPVDPVKTILSVGSMPGGFQVGSRYVFSGTATPGSAVAIWWDLQGGSNWRSSTSGFVGSDGRYRLEVALGSAARFQFVATSGTKPGGGNTWETAPVPVNAVHAKANPGVLNVGSAPGGFHVGASYVFSGQASPGMSVSIWWDVEQGKNWRPTVRTVAGADGRYRAVVKIGSAARFKFIATSGELPGSGIAGSWQTNPNIVNAFPAGTNPLVMKGGSAPGGFVVGSKYVISGRTSPGMPVTLWWDLPGNGNWRVSGQTVADTAGNYRFMLPISGAGTVWFMATEGHRPNLPTPNGGWYTQRVSLRSVAKAPAPPVKTMKLDPRCKTGRVICISKRESSLAWVINGKIQFVMDVRFGSPNLPTRNGAFKVNWKSRNHVSSIYHSAMPFSLFFDGGRAVHFSRSFMNFGYAGNSAGCVNTRDYEQSAILFDLARVGDRVIVF